MITLRLLILFLSIGFTCAAQNSIRILAADGQVFRLKIKGNLVNPQPQSGVLTEPIKEDSITIVVEFENGSTFQSPVYLLEKGKPCTGKEFSYRLDPSEKKVKLIFLGMYDMTSLPNPLVPNKPVRDTMTAHRNRFMGHLCELKNGKPIYFNNLPKNGKCTEPMPDTYLDFAHLLIKDAQIDEEKIHCIENICSNNCLSASQFSLLTTYTNYEIEKLNLLKIAYFNFTDPENAINLKDCFRFEASQREFNIFLKNTDDYKQVSGSNCVTPSDSVEIKKIKDQLAKYSNDAERYLALKKSYSSYCYSLVQVKEIMQLFIHDRELTEVAKLLYFYCTEKENYLSLLDLFSYNESKNTLRTFVEKQVK